MSEIKVNSIKGVGASAAAITVNNTDGTCTANITNNLSNRNLIINGAMQVAQRGTSSTSNGHQTVDRYNMNASGHDEAPTQAQADVASGTTPYTLGFRKSLKITNGNQTSGAGAADRLRILYVIEAQDIANSGWNYTDSNSKITLSFWVKSSVSQNFYFRATTSDGTSYNFPMETGSLSANTWTKITKTIPGNSNLAFNNDNGIGLYIIFAMMRGTDNTDSGVALNTWAATSSGVTLYPNFTTTWWTTNDSTWELTGLQLEVSDHATDFEHKSFAQELALCQRYYQRIPLQDGSTAYHFIASGMASGTTAALFTVPFKTTMRANPSLGHSGSFRVYNGGGVAATGISTNAASVDVYSLQVAVSSGLSTATGVLFGTNNDVDAHLQFSAEL